MSTIARTVPLVLLVATLAGCASEQLVFGKPDTAAADLQRDQNECLLASMSTEGAKFITPRVDHELLVRCMQARGYTLAAR